MKKVGMFTMIVEILQVEEPKITLQEKEPVKPQKIKSNARKWNQETAFYLRILEAIE